MSSRNSSKSGKKWHKRKVRLLFSLRLVIMGFWSYSWSEVQRTFDKKIKYDTSKIYSYIIGFFIFLFDRVNQMLGRKNMSHANISQFTFSEMLIKICNCWKVIIKTVSYENCWKDDNDIYIPYYLWLWI